MNTAWGDFLPALLALAAGNALTRVLPLFVLHRPPGPRMRATLSWLPAALTGMLFVYGLSGHDPDLGGRFILVAALALIFAARRITGRSMFSLVLGIVAYLMAVNLF